MEKSLYYYRANVVYVYDGDTITVDIDLGLKVFVHGEKIRLSRINTPEIRGEERPDGLKARDYLRNLIMNKNIFIETIKDKKGKYGRYLGEIFLPDENGKLINVNDLLVENGFAEYREY
ncbi:MAG: thermonuclease family protein [Melioribacteraceae bacterium]|nr:thermonuclease family protein [Melioribacteraceae bacterium]